MSDSTAKETDNLKRPIAEEEEEIKPKKRKEDHNQSSKGDLIVCYLLLNNKVANFPTFPLKMYVLGIVFILGDKIKTYKLGLQNYI